MGLKSSTGSFHSDEQREALKSLSEAVCDTLILLKEHQNAADASISLKLNINLAVDHLTYCRDKLADMGF